MPTLPQPDYARWARLFRDLPKPFAFVDLDRLDANIAQVLAYSGDARIRVGSKSVRVAAMLRHILASDPRFSGLLCFTAPEAVWLSSLGFDDLVVAYPTWEPSHIAAVAERVRAGAQITLMIDSVAHVEHIAALTAGSGVRLPLCLDLDMATNHYGIHFGAWRSPVRKPYAVREVVTAIQRCDHLLLDGVMGYEAQIAGTADAAPGQRLMNSVIRHLKRRSRPIVEQRRADAVATIDTAGISLRFVNGGGSGSLSSTAADPFVDEVTAGSAFYCPHLFSHYSDYAFTPAAGFVLEVVRRASDDIYTCLGGGYIASGAAGPDRLPQVWLPAGAELIDLEGAGEVQTPVRYRGPETLGLGSPVVMRHAKAGELMERFNEVVLIRGDQIIDTVPTYRGEGQCFL